MKVGEDEINGGEDHDESVAVIAIPRRHECYLLIYQ
jgi:hypothetical protein